MKDILETLERWTASLRVATATVVETERSAPRDPGAVLAVSERGEVAGSVTGGCVERPCTRRRGGRGRRRAAAQDVRDRRRGGVRGRAPMRRNRAHLRRRARPGAGRTRRRSHPRRAADRDRDGDLRLRDRHQAARSDNDLLARGRTGSSRLTTARSSSTRSRRVRTCTSSRRRPRRGVADIGRFLGFRVTVCDARAKFATRERFPNVGDVVVEWPDRFLGQAPVDERTAICVLTHDHKFDVPLLKVALESRPATSAQWAAGGRTRNARSGSSGGHHRRAARPGQGADRARHRLADAERGRGRRRSGIVSTFSPSRRKQAVAASA